jgi:hypothetical protein
LSSSTNNKIDSNTNNHRPPLHLDPNVVLVPPLRTDCWVRNNLVSATTSDASTTMQLANRRSSSHPILRCRLPSSTHPRPSLLGSQRSTSALRFKVKLLPVLLDDSSGAEGLHGHLIRPPRRPTLPTMGTCQPMGMAMGPIVTQPASSSTRTNRTSGMTSITRFTGRSSIFLDMMARQIRCHG